MPFSLNELAKALKETQVLQKSVIFGNILPKY